MCAAANEGHEDYSPKKTEKKSIQQIRFLKSTVQRFEERVRRLEADIKDSQKRATELEAKVGRFSRKRIGIIIWSPVSRKLRRGLTSPRIRHQVRWILPPRTSARKNTENQTETKSIPQARRAAVRV